MQHVHTDYNIKTNDLRHEGDQLQHAKNIIATPVNHDYNIIK
jgi:hypothetical protein